jgi:hypothetical protein
VLHCGTRKIEIWKNHPDGMAQEWRNEFLVVSEVLAASETSVNFYQTTRRYNPEDSHLRTHRRENLKSHKHHRDSSHIVYLSKLQDTANQKTLNDI